MTGSLQIKNGKYFAVLNFRDQHGKRVQKWFSLGLDVKGNKRRAETMLNELLVQYQGIENIEPMNTLLSRHIASWIEMDKPNISVTTYNQYVNILNLHIVQGHFLFTLILHWVLRPGAQVHKEDLALTVTQISAVITATFFVLVQNPKGNADIGGNEQFTRQDDNGFHLIILNEFFTDFHGITVA